MTVSRRTAIIAGLAALAPFPCASGGWFGDMVADLDETAFAFDGAGGAKFDGGYRWQR